MHDITYGFIVSTAFLCLYTVILTPIVLVPREASPKQAYHYTSAAQTMNRAPESTPLYFAQTGSAYDALPTLLAQCIPKGVSDSNPALEYLRMVGGFGTDGEARGVAQAISK